MQSNKPVCVLLPAYGRKYKTKAAALEHWREGKDFVIINGAYTSIRDKALLDERFSKVVIYWSPNSTQTSLDVTNEKEPV